MTDTSRTGAAALAYVERTTASQFISAQDAAVAASDLRLLLAQNDALLAEVTAWRRRGYVPDADSALILAEARAATDAVFGEKP